MAIFLAEDLNGSDDIRNGWYFRKQWKPFPDVVDGWKYNSQFSLRPCKPFAALLIQQLNCTTFICMLSGNRRKSTSPAGDKMKTKMV